MHTAVLLALVLGNWENRKEDLESERASLKLPYSQHSDGFLRDLRWLLVEIYLLTAPCEELALSLVKTLLQTFQKKSLSPSPSTCVGNTPGFFVSFCFLVGLGFLDILPSFFPPHRGIVTRTYCLILLKSQNKHLFLLPGPPLHAITRTQNINLIGKGNCHGGMWLHIDRRLCNRTRHSGNSPPAPNANAPCQPLPPG